VDECSVGVVEGRIGTTRKKWLTLPTAAVFIQLARPSLRESLFATGFFEKIEFEKTVKKSPGTAPGRNRVGFSRLHRNLPGSILGRILDFSKSGRLFEKIGEEPLGKNVHDIF